MTIDKTGPVDPALRIAPVTGDAAPPAAGETGFQALLEALERLRVHGGTTHGSEAVHELGRAVGAADDAHRATMDLKQRLEDAFRRALGEA
jgi:hypothetical protein